MAATGEFYLAGMQLILDGTYDIEAASLELTLYDDTWTPYTVDDTTSWPYDLGSETHVVHTFTITSQAWTYDADTRTLVLAPSGTPFSWSPGADTTFQYAVLHDAGTTHPPFMLYRWGAPQSALLAEEPHSIPLDSLMSIRLFSSLQPTPQGVVYEPLVLDDHTGGHWRVTGLSGVLGSVATSEADTRESWLTSPDTATHKLVVSTSGVVTAQVSGGTPADGDRIFDGTHPCLLPSEDPQVQHILTVSNVGVLTVT